ncbi:MAG: polysaccharide biosynthesis tyrosine autokinase [Muribaculaceae bacterium]|nr:polysaccharide biosynthesis tyrosine autokinase [Muribaculaceae bacterium]
MKDINVPQEEFDAEQQEASSVNLRLFFKQCLDNWYWFLISIVVCLGIGAFYLMKATPTYESTALVQIRDDKNGAPLNSDFANTFADLGMFSSSADIFNELLAIRSPRLLGQVVDNLDLQVSYTTRNKLKELPLYGDKLPFIVDFVDGGTKGRDMTLTVEQGDTVGTLSDFVTYINGDEIEYDDIVRFNTSSIDTLNTPVGRVLLRPNATFSGDKDAEHDIKIAYRSRLAATERLSSIISADLADDHATVIKLNIIDSSPQRAQDILDNLIAMYNQSWVDDRNQIARATSHFINDRLVGLEGELSDVDTDISSFKSQNLVPDVDEASSLYLKQATKTSDEILELNNQLSMANYVRDYLSNPAHSTSLMPANSGTGVSGIDNQIVEYNRLMIERNNLATSSSENHPRVRQYDTSLDEMRSAVLTAIDNQIVALNTAIQSMKQSQANANARIAANPTQAKYLLSVGRQQKVKESLYLYLLQKREENELSQTFAPYNTRILQDASFPTVPVAPQKAIILAAAFLIGLLIPTVWIYIYQMYDDKIRSRRDIESLSLPFIGELPQVGKKARFGRSKDIDTGILVRHGKSDAVNEAFRMLRSNLEFMTRDNDNPVKVIMVTSAIPGSGKTFVSMNLAASLALKNRKVLLIDLDLRRHSLSRQLADKSHQGVSAYLSGSADIAGIITHIDGNDNLDLMPAGVVPPNPAELIGSKRLEQLLDYARSHYDIVIIDCPPTESVADARVLTPLVDMTLYVVRVGRLERTFLPEIERMYRENRYTRMGLVLNGAHTSGVYSYNYGYGYGYSSRH